MASTSQALSAAAAVVSGRPRDGRWYVLAVLIVAYVLAHIDRQVLSLLVEPMKRDLHLTDTQIGLLQGFSFALFLTLAGLALGRLADSGRRVRIITLGIVAWSALTASCALASSYTQLLVCRMGVGIGEATLLPAAHSIIADSFPRPRLGLALGIFGIGSYIGAGLALLAGAVIIAHLPQSSFMVLPLIGAVRPWQIVFLALGAPGLLVAAWVGSLREPTRRTGDPPASLLEARRYVLANARSIVLVNLTGGFCAMAVYGANAWIPSYFIRTFGWSAPLSGMLYGSVIIVCGVTGVIGGGALSDLAVSRGLVSGRPLVMALACLCAVPLAAMTPLVADPRLSLVLLVPFTLLTTTALGILPAAQQGMTPARMRGFMASLGAFMVNLIGLGLGPSLVALMTDHVFHDPGKLRYSLAALLPCMLFAAALCGFCSARPYRESVNRLGADR